MAKNQVIAGEHQGKFITDYDKLVINVGFTKKIPLNSTTVESYELITDEHRKSAASGVARGLVGGALLGPVGMLAGAMSAKNKSTYQLAIQFKDGTRSLLEVDDKIYRAIVKACF